VPVVSAVGHEIDVTLADLVADRRAATPSEAAEMVVPEIARLSARLNELSRAARLGLARRIAGDRARLEAKGGRLRARDPRVRLGGAKVRLAHAEEALRAWHKRALAESRAALAERTARLDALSPLAVLARGFAVVRRASDAAIVRAPDDAPAGTELDVALARGRLFATVTRSGGGTS
jgi:exodeoxyribonuclease VII large subunit